MTTVRPPTARPPRQRPVVALVVMVILAAATVIVLAFVLLIRPSPPEASADGSPTPTATADQPTVEPSSPSSVDASPGQTSVAPSARPSPPARPPAGLIPYEPAEVAVDGLRVRQLPGLARPFMSGYHGDSPTGPLARVTNAVRLSSGHRVYVLAGPLLLDGAWWYRVQNLPPPPGEGPDQALVWGTSRDNLPDVGWVAGAVSDQAYLVAEDSPPPNPGPPPPYWTMHGVESATGEVINFPPLDEGVCEPHRSGVVRGRSRRTGLPHRRDHAA